MNVLFSSRSCTFWVYLLRGDIWLCLSLSLLLLSPTPEMEGALPPQLLGGFTGTSETFCTTNLEDKLCVLTLHQMNDL